MPSEQRLHPFSVLFAFGESLKRFALPGLLVTLGAGRASSDWQPAFGNVPVPQGWELWLMLLLIPSGLAALARYFSFRLRYDDTELVIRSGILFRNERHVPYHRIQNLEAVQNLFHRALRVMEVRIETGAGKEPEATISVLPSSAFPDMRRRVFAGRTSPDTVASETVAAPADDPGRTLLRLPLRELLLCGFIENRGLVIIGAVYGLLWESGILGAIWTGVFGSGAYSRGLVRGMIRSAVSGGGIPIAQIALAVVGVAGLLLTVRIVSMGWAVVRLHGFQLTRAGEDLRTEFGLFTHVAATIPLQRVQTMTVREGPLHRLLGRVSVRVETAGGTGTPGQQATEREWLAPIVRRRDLPALAQQVVPGLDLDALTWQPPHPRAFRRAVKPALFLALLMTTLLCTVVHWRMIAVLPFALVWAVVGTRQYLKHYGWAATDEAVALRSGWLRRSVTIARVAKIQAVTRLESPFDRRTDMARVRVDTAGAGERSHRIDVLYLPREAAVDLHRRLAAGAAGTAFRW